MSLISVALADCQSSDPQPLREEPPVSNEDDIRPLVDITFNGFDPERTTLRFTEGETITFEIESISNGVQTISLAQTSGPQVNFGAFRTITEESNENLNVGNGQGDVTFTLADVEGPREAIINTFNDLEVSFQAPNVTQATILNFQFRSASPTESRIRNIPITIENDALAITLNGQVSKGLVTNTDVELLSVDNLIFGNREIIDPVEIDETGNYSFTVLPSTDFEELLRFEVEGDGANMVCDAPQGCNEFAFGEIFEVEDDLDLRALIDVPPLGSTQIVNINIMTTLATSRAGELNGFSRVSPENLSDAREDVASVLGLDNQIFSAVPFIDVTQPITSNDENAVRIAIMSGGILGATFLHSDPDDDEDYLEELDDFIDEFGERQVFCRDAPDQPTISIEDIMAQSLEIANINGDQLTQNFFLGRLSAIQNGAFNCNFVTPPRASDGG